MTSLGGYKSKKALRCVLLFMWIGTFLVIPMPFTDDFYWFFGLLWATLFFGGTVIPALTGIMLNTVEDKLRGSANSIS